MPPTLENPERAHRKYIAVLAIAAGGILAAGVVLRPAKRPAGPPVSETEMVRLERLAQRRGLEEMASYFSGVAEDAFRRLLRVKGTGVAGFAWDARGLVLVPAALENEARAYTVERGSREMRAAVASSSPEMGLTFLRIQAAPVVSPFVTATPESLDPGSWIVQVSGRAGGESLFAPGIYAGVVPARCEGLNYRQVRTSLPLLHGSGLFNLDGELLAVVLRCGEHEVAVAASDVDRLLRRADSLDGQLLSRYGLRLGVLDEASRSYFGVANGVLVVETWKGRAADRAGLKPGDVIVKLGESPVEFAADLEPLLEGGPVFRLEVRRNRRRAEAKLAVPGCEAVLSEPAGLAFEAPGGLVIESVEQGSPAAAAGVRAGDRLLDIGGRPPRGRAALRRALSSSARTYLVLERGARNFGVFLNR